MPIPPWADKIVSIAFPFLIGLLIGGIIKQALKFAIAILALLAVAPYFGYENVPSVSDFVSTLRQGVGTARSIFDWLPLHSGIFIVGVAIGFWKF